MFTLECQLAPIAGMWLRSQGMLVKQEFVSPWGICDLVGVRLNGRQVQKRLKLKQRKPVTSILRASLLLRIPDTKTGKTTSVEQLAQDCNSSISREVITEETTRLISERFVIQTGTGGLQKVNGWMPLQKRVVAVELKLSRISDAMRQAMNNLGFAEKSYVALPMGVAKGVASKREQWKSFFAAGIGLLGIQESGCNVLVPAKSNEQWIDPATKFYCVEKFWATRPASS
jgi:hypothetical protein